MVAMVGQVPGVDEYIIVANYLKRELYINNYN